MRVIIYIMIIMIIPSVFAATTINEYSGIVRGSVDYEVRIDHTDSTPVMAEEVRPNDIITIVYGKGPTGLDLKTSYFFKTYVNEAWRYEILRGERNLEVAIGEAIELDYDNDGISDIFLTLKEWDGRKGDFEISAQVSIPIEPEPQVEPEPEPQVEEPVVIVDEGQDDLGLTEVEEEPVVQPTNPVPEPVKPVQQETEETPMALWVLIGVLLLAVLGAVAYTFLTDTTPKEKSKKKK